MFMVMRFFKDIVDFASLAYDDVNVLVVNDDVNFVFVNFVDVINDILISIILFMLLVVLVFLLLCKP